MRRKKSFDTFDTLQTRTNVEWTTRRRRWKFRLVDTNSVQKKPSSPLLKPAVISHTRCLAAISGGGADQWRSGYVECPMDIAGYGIDHGSPSLDPPELDAVFFHKPFCDLW